MLNLAKNADLNSTVSDYVHNVGTERTYNISDVVRKDTGNIKLDIYKNIQ